jgi:AhpD family alkylhydroperoxidase
VVVTDIFPAVTETFIRAEAGALVRLGYRVRVESPKRPAPGRRASGEQLAAAYLEDDSRSTRWRDLVWLGARHPVRFARDLLARRRWRREEAVTPLRDIAPLVRRVAASGDRHLHAHFAAGGALIALRASRLTGCTYSVTAHAHDIFKRTTNLREKLERAAFATSGCDYNVRYLRTLVDAEHAERIHRIVMGVDGERFRRRTAYPGGRAVVAIGRLVEKKGFAHLLDAVAALEASSPLDRLVVLGGGALRKELRQRARRLGIAGKVDWLGNRPHADVKDLLEQADLLAAPCVVAESGDRDSMPVVVKEALAMEVPVVASDEVGLPEVVRPGWGRLAAPGDAAALATAIDELLALPPERRVEMGRAGREFVLTTCDVDRETAKLARLIDEARSP